MLESESSRNRVGIESESSRNRVGIESESSRNRVGIVHKNCVGGGVGIVTKMNGIGVGIGIEKVCWNGNRNH